MSAALHRGPSHPLEHRFDTGAYVVALAVNRAGGHAAAALGDGTVWLLDLADGDRPPTVVQAHDGACLALVRDVDGAGFLTGGDDGRLRRIAPGEAPLTLAEAPGRWIEHVDATAGGGLRAWAAGRQVRLLDAAGRERGGPLDHPSTVGGLAFAPSGKRVAVAHYGGVSLWWTGQAGAPVRLDWKGSHLGVLWHPQGTHLMTTLQECGLHGWRMRDKADLQMDGYPTKVRSMGWTRGARHLATAGAEALVCWPFTGGGPWNRRPLELAAVGLGLVCTVAPHPAEAVVATGYDSGAVALVPLDSSAPASVCPTGEVPVSALAWSDDGRHLLVGTEDGRLSWFPIPARPDGPRGNR